MKYSKNKYLFLSILFANILLAFSIFNQYQKNLDEFNKQLTSRLNSLNVVMNVVQVEKNHNLIIKYLHFLNDPRVAKFQVKDLSVNWVISENSSDDLEYNYKYVLKSNGKDAISVKVRISKYIVFKLTLYESWVYITLIFALILSSLGFMYIIGHKERKEVEIIVGMLDRDNQFFTEGDISILSKFMSSNLKKLALLFHSKNVSLNEAQETIKEQSVNAAVGKMARQVSHDIRSPLAALSMAIKDIDHLPEDKRYILRNATQRIQDIANNLLAKRKKEEKIIRLEKEMLSTCIDEIISEKRFHYRSKLNIEIIGDLRYSHGLFSNINSVEFKRILSNLINNSVESIEDAGFVKLSAGNTDGKNQIAIEDNGKGIPAELIDKVTEADFSHGKEKNSESGSGIGLYHAKSVIETWGGSLEIESVVGKGTKIIISLDRETPPAWFLEKLEISTNETILILDDDQGIHETWRQKLSEISNEIIHFSTPEEVKEWISSNNKEIFCLFDYEIIKNPTSGLDLIEELGLGKKAVLVTSYYDEDTIKKRAEKIGTRILPKADVDIVPIENKLKVSTKTMYDAVYIEDNDLLRMGWEMHARKRGINLLVLPNTRNFFIHVRKISKENTEIYLDRDLGAGEVMGDQFSKKLHKEGFKRLFLVSGSDKKDLEELSFLTYLEKKCPWED